jgi:hypothetical protein
VEGSNFSPTPPNNSFEPTANRAASIRETCVYWRCVRGGSIRAFDSYRLATMHCLFREISISLIILAFVATAFSPRYLAQRKESLDRSLPILEISFRSFDAYSSWCKEPLHTRLYADGRLERESCELPPPHNKDSAGKYIVTRKQYRATSKQLTEITRLAQELDFVNAKPGYSGGSMADAAIDITMIYHGKSGLKRIRLWNVVPHDTNQDLPASLNKIFREIEAIKKALFL